MTSVANGRCLGGDGLQTALSSGAISEFARQSTSICDKNLGSIALNNTMASLSSAPVLANLVHRRVPVCLDLTQMQEIPTTVRHYAVTYRSWCTQMPKCMCIYRTSTTARRDPGLFHLPSIVFPLGDFI